MIDNANPDEGALTVDKAVEGLISADEPEQDTPTDSDALASEEPEVEEQEAQDDGESEVSEGEEEQEVYQVKVNGETLEVPLDELVKGYQLETDYRNKTSEIAVQRRTLEERAQQLDREREANVAKLDKLIEDFSDVSAEPDWVALAKEDPLQMMEQKAIWEARQAKAQALQQERDEMAARHQQAVLERESLRLTQLIPEWSDPKVKAEEQNKIVQHAINHYGYSAEDLASTNRATDVAVLRDAYLYGQLKEKGSVVKKKVAKAPKVVKPGAATTKSQANSQRRKDSLQKLKKTGSLEDAVNLLVGD